MRALRSLIASPLVAALSAIMLIVVGLAYAIPTRQPAAASPPPATATQTAVKPACTGGQAPYSYAGEAGKESQDSFGPPIESVEEVRIRLCGSEARGGDKLLFQAFKVELGERKINQPLTTEEWRRELPDLDRRIRWSETIVLDQIGPGAWKTYGQKNGKLFTAPLKNRQGRYFNLAISGGPATDMTLRGACGAQPVHH